MKNFLVVIILLFGIQFVSAQDDYKTNLYNYVENVLGLRTIANTDRDANLNIVSDDNKILFSTSYNQILDDYISEIVGVYNVYYENNPQIIEDAVQAQNANLPELVNQAEMNQYINNFTQIYNSKITYLKQKYVIHP